MFLSAKGSSHPYKNTLMSLGRLRRNTQVSVLMITTLQKMAKKINFKTIDEVYRASNALKDLHVEHVHVRYEEGEVIKEYLVVRNCLLSDAKIAFEAAHLTPCKIKNSRHYENTAKNHKFYKP